MATATGMEIEWQFDAESIGAVEAWLKAAAVPGFSLAPRGMKHLSDTYYDTPAWRIHHAGFTCRVRASGGTWVLTLKGMADPRDGLRARREIEQELPPVAGEPSLHAPGTARDYLRAIAGSQPIRAIFRVETSRTAYTLLDRAGPLGEIALDDTAVSPEGNSSNPLRLARIEVEVTEATRDRARPFVQAIVQGCALRPARLSKFEAGLQANGLDVAPVAPAFPAVALSAALPACDYAIAVLRRQLAELLSCEAGTRLGEDIEALHDMRVATRRMRAAFRVFRPYLPAEWEGFREELGWLGGVLGAVRDLDVQLADLRTWGGEQAPNPAVVPLEGLLVERHADARREMLAALDSPRYEAFTAAFTRALLNPPAGEAEAPKPIGPVAGDLVRDAHLRFRRRARGIGHASEPAAYHRLRIEAKRLRYTIEFLQPLYGKPASRYLVAVRTLQDHLGLHQDREVAAAHLRELSTAAGPRLGPATAFAMGEIAERYRAEAEALRQRFPKAFRPTTGRRWRRLRRRLERGRRPALPRSDD